MGHSTSNWYWKDIMEHAHTHASGLAICLQSHQAQTMAFSHHGQEQNYCRSWPTFEQNELFYTLLQN